MLDAFLKYLEMCVGDIYVWGAAGQTDISEKWIRSREKSEEHAQAAINLWNKRKSEGRNPIRAFDCSGYVSKALMSIGVLEGRRDCDNLYIRCTRIDTPKNGALLFRVNSSDPNDETHVGVYFNGYQYHSKGRAYGVVKEPYDPSYWKKIAWFKKLVEEPEPITSTLYFSHTLRKGNVCADVSKLKRLLIAQGIGGVTVGNENYGNSTASAVSKFQSKVGIAQTGVADEETIVKLGGVYAKETS
jgi:hypothetical protein